MVSYWIFAPSNGLVFGLLVVEPVAEQKAKIPVRNFQVLEIRPVLGSGSIPVVGVENLLVMVEIRDFRLVEILFRVFWIGAGFIGLFF